MFYADSSFLVAAYVVQPDSKRALQWMQKNADPLPFTPFHRHEVRIALRQMVFRHEISSESCANALKQIELDLEEMILAHTPIPWTEAFREADRIGKRVGEKEPIRSSDLLHIGIALALKTREFLSFDQRQKSVAKTVGFKLVFS
jgi:predicted nucleic acid-binding protein